jgi:hypothetical protein
MHVTLAQCWTYPTTAATMFMYRGYRLGGMNVVHTRIKARWVGPFLPMCQFGITPLVRANALGFVDFRDSASRLPSSIANAIGNHLLDSTLSGSGSPLRISTEIGSASSTSQRKTSMQAGRDDACNPQNSSFQTDLSESRTLYDSPKDVVICDGWCGYDIIQHATVVRATYVW